MIMKDRLCQIKAELMKDRHQSASSLEALRNTTWLSRRRNMVTHRAPISISWPIDLNFISISLAFIAAVMNGRTTHTLRPSGSLRKKKAGKQ